MRERRWVLACAAACLALLAAWARADPLAITVGDSLVRNYTTDPASNPIGIQGWGHEIRRYFGPGLQWRNDAVGFESTRSFIAEGRWAATVAAHPRFILIMFGFNDYEGDPNHYADTTLYGQNLHQMATDARAIGAEPIFVTPPPVRFAAADGFHVLRPNLIEAYADAMTAQGAADGVPVADLQYWLLDTYDQLGVPTAQKLYGVPVGAGMDAPDPVHFSLYGADQAARHIVSQLPQIAPDLAAFRVQTPAPVLPFWALAAFVAALALAVSVGARARVR